MDACARQRRKEGAFSLDFLTHPLSLDWESTLATQGHISMPRGSLEPQLSGWRPEAGGVSLAAVSLGS